MINKKQNCIVQANLKRVTSKWIVLKQSLTNIHRKPLNWTTNIQESQYFQNAHTDDPFF